ncbi:hypothetical protein phi32_27 [Escherichia phage phiEco32]|uniref:Uncharacterized protein n=3 Tax=Kuravirus TaxID=680277 RepID=B0FII9_BPE32|nr:hypothetical protein phi32_27 [Escherichia phage phiEco32]YP_010674091.1 hypothetical protein PQC56_gp033 [Escherichia phage MN03]ABY52828.1 hypothetical protein phi32_27 [Escherichia phage phiEco32]AVQ10020.1 hypothetical protein PSH1131_015 [Escherichia phage myPSH1131]QIN95701.1 hypothetical protein MN03_00033 [Escherichia phage MN03]
MKKLLSLEVNRIGSMEASQDALKMNIQTSEENWDV